MAYCNFYVVIDYSILKLELWFTVSLF